MKSLRTYILTLLCGLLVLLGTGCGNSRVADKLARADRLMEEHPDSARLLLDGIDPSKLSRANTPLYAVLDAQSRHKLDLPAPSDSLLNIAVDHYTLHGPDSLLMKALFYRAVGYLEREDIDDAIADATSAHEISTYSRSFYWQAKTGDLIADMYHTTLNMTEEIPWRSRVANYYRRAGRTDCHLFCLSDLVAAYGHAGNPAKALALADSIRPLIEQHPEIPTLKSYYYGYALPVYAYFGNPRIAQEIFDSLTSDGVELPLVYTVYQSRIKLRSGEAPVALDVIDKYFPKATSALDSISFLVEYANCFAALGDYKRAYTSGDEAIRKQFVVFHKAMAQPVALSQRDLYASRYSEEALRNARQTHYLWAAGIIAACLVIVIIGILWLLRRNRRREEQHMMRDLEEIRALREEMSRQKILNSNLKSDIQDIQGSNEGRIQSLRTELSDTLNKIQLQTKAQEILYRQKWEIINRICHEFYTSEDKPRTPEHTVKKLRPYIESLRDPSLFADVEFYVNQHMNGLMTRIKEECGFLKEQDFIFLTLLFAGFSAKSISFFTGTQLNYFYTKRDRLHKRISTSDAPSKEEICGRIKDA